MNTASVHTGAFKSVPLLNYHPVEMNSNLIILNLANFIMPLMLFIVCPLLPKIVISKSE